MHTYSGGKAKPLTDITSEFGHADIVAATVMAVSTHDVLEHA